MEQAIRIVGVPMSGRHSASTRLRYFSLEQHLPKAQFSLTKFSPDTDWDRCDVFYIQKHALPSICELAKALRAHGKKVIFDIDDDLDMMENDLGKEFFLGRTLIDIVDLVTVDTIERKLSISKHSKTPIAVVPDPLDYWDYLSQPNPRPVSEKIVRIASFGNVANCVEASRWLEPFSPFFEYGFITNASDKIRGNLIPWSYETFIPTLQQFDACLLTHPNNSEGKLKSNNRLLVAFAAGIPPIVSNSPSFSETMLEAGLSELVAATSAEVKPILDKLQDPRFRKRIRQQGRDYVLAHFHPLKSAQRFGEVVTELLNR